ncbi:hypothetical protein [Pseudomonas huaxiensis]|uniref:hypothetical protein n=1 Tax=Pseudomonas huaxiensis TaxID=2213017 RepID=UPI000DA686A3|nr:hypothetical protein [Pseudomonas huaxiensis]
MTEVVDLQRTAATAALQVVIELIRAGQIKAGVRGSEAEAAISAHKQLTAYFEESKGTFPGNISVTR